MPKDFPPLKKRPPDRAEARTANPEAEMRPPLLPPDEYEEIAYVRSLSFGVIRNVNAYFDEKYPNGSPFVPSPADYALLDLAEPLLREKIAAGRDRYPMWTNEDIDSLAKMVRTYLLMRFKRVERTISKMPDWRLSVEGILEAGKDAAEARNEPFVSAEIRALPLRPNLRIVRSENAEAE